MSKKSELRREKLRFIEAALSSDTDGCIEWPWGRNAYGYGVMGWGAERVIVSRHVCIRAKGAPPIKKAHAAHHCGNPACINPGHIRWATPAENNADKLLHGTGGTALTDDEVIRARLRYAMGETMFAIAQDLPVTVGSVQLAIRGQTFAYLPFAVR